MEVAPPFVQTLITHTQGLFVCFADSNQYVDPTPYEEGEYLWGGGRIWTCTTTYKNLHIAFPQLDVVWHQTVDIVYDHRACLS